MKYIIDRFEGEFAVVETENSGMVNMPRALLPLDAKEGDIINITIEKGETEQRAKQMEEKMQSLFKRNTD